jgi:hypothetical protein
MPTSSVASRLEKACSPLKWVVARVSGAGWIDDHGTEPLWEPVSRATALAVPFTVAVTVVLPRAVLTSRLAVAADQTWPPSRICAWIE